MISKTKKSNGLEILILLRLACLANLRALQGRNVELLMKDGCGLKPLQPSGRFDHNGRCWRTFQGCFGWKTELPSTEFYQDWPKSGMTVGGKLFRLVPLVRHTDGIESGLLLTTPTRDNAIRSERFGRGKPNPREAIKMLSTPSASVASCRRDGTWTGKYFIKSNGKKSQTRLADQIGMLPIPRARDYRGYARVNSHGTYYMLNEEVGKKTGLKLQPAFAEWMMGFPIGWTEINE